MTTQRKFEAAGKQVLLNGGHYADARTTVVADEIVNAMGTRESIAAYIEAEASNKGRTRYVRQQLRALAGNVRARMDLHEVAPEGERATYNEGTT